MSLPALTIPGQPIAPTNKYSPGPGTHQANNTITASILGPPSSQRNSTTSKSSKLVTIPPAPRSLLLPDLKSIVYARITRLERQQARCLILAFSDRACSTPLRALLRSQDVRATEKDKVKLGECFHVGDIIRAVVIGLGDQSGYYLSTAGNENGVVMAWSEAGNGCVPISWCEVRDAVTGSREGRKVAKPV